MGGFYKEEAPSWSLPEQKGSFLASYFLHLYWAGPRVCLVGDNREQIGWNSSWKKPGRKGWASPRTPGASHILDAEVPGQWRYTSKVGVYWRCAGLIWKGGRGGHSQQHLGQGLTSCLGLGRQAVYTRSVSKGVVTWRSLRKLGCEMLIDARCHGTPVEELDPEHLVPSQQPSHVKKAGTAYVKKRRPGRSRGGASSPAVPIGPCHRNVRNSARETQAGWLGRGAGVEPGVPSGVRPHPSSGLRREAQLPLRPAGAVPAKLYYRGAGRAEL